jgi:hypothetical protein
LHCYWLTLAAVDRLIGVVGAVTDHMIQCNIAGVALRFMNVCDGFTLKSGLL